MNSRSATSEANIYLFKNKYSFINIILFVTTTTNCKNKLIENRCTKINLQNKLCCSTK